MVEEVEGEATGRGGVGDWTVAGVEKVNTEVRQDDETRVAIAEVEDLVAGVPTSVG